MIVATVRLLKMNGRGSPGTRSAGKTWPHVQDPACAEPRSPNFENVKGFGGPVVVAINHFAGDTEGGAPPGREGVFLDSRSRGRQAAEGRRPFFCNHWAEGSAGIAPLARRGGRGSRMAMPRSFAPPLPR